MGVLSSLLFPLFLLLLQNSRSVWCQQGEWQKLEVSVPDARAFQAATAGDDGKSMYMFGGYSQHYERCLRDVWHLDAQKEVWTKLTEDVRQPAFGMVDGLPPPVWGHELLFSREGSDCEESGCLVSVGGNQDCPGGGTPPATDTRRYIDHVWQFSLQTNEWRQIAASGNTMPEGRWGHAAVSIPSKDSAVQHFIIGGGGSDLSQSFNNTFQLKFSVDEAGAPIVLWEERMSLPLQLAWHSAETHEGKAYVFGGLHGNISMPYSNRLFVYDPAVDQWTEVSSAQFERAYHQSFILGSRMYILGGLFEPTVVFENFDIQTQSLPSWIAMEAFDLESRQWLREEERKNLAQWTESPPILKGAISIVADGKVYLMGDKKGVEGVGQYWAYVNRKATFEWERQRPANPPPRTDAHLVRLSDDRLILLGGYYLHYSQANPAGPHSWDKRFRFENIWEYNGGEWTALDIGRPNPEAGVGHSVVAVNETMLLMFGGHGESQGRELSDEVWALRLEDNKKASWYKLNNKIRRLEVLHASGRIRHSAVFFPNYGNGEGAMFVFGGVVGTGGIEDNGAVNELWAFDLATKKWYLHVDLKSGEDDKPMARWDHSCIRMGIKAMLCYGGFDMDDAALSDLWVFELGDGLDGQKLGKWTRIFDGNRGPSARAYFSLNPIPGTSNMFVLFGGESETEDTDYQHHDIWVLQVSCGKAYWQEVFPNPPNAIPVHRDHAAAFLSEGRLAVFGGQAGNLSAGHDAEDVGSFNWLWQLNWNQCLSAAGAIKGTCPHMRQVPDACIDSPFVASARVQIFSPAENAAFGVEDIGTPPMIEDQTGSSLSYQSYEYKGNATWILRGIQMRDPEMHARLFAEIDGVSVGSTTVLLKNGTQVDAVIYMDELEPLEVRVSDAYSRSGIAAVEVELFLVSDGKRSSRSCYSRRECDLSMTDQRGIAAFNVYPLRKRNPATQHYVVRATASKHAVSEQIVGPEENLDNDGRVVLVLQNVKASVENASSHGSKGNSVHIRLHWGRGGGFPDLDPTERRKVNVCLKRKEERGAKLEKKWAVEQNETITIRAYGNLADSGYFVQVEELESGQLLARTPTKYLSEDNHYVIFDVPITFDDMKFRVQFPQVANRLSPVPANAAVVSLYYGKWNSTSGRPADKNLVERKKCGKEGSAQFKNLFANMVYTAFFAYSNEDLRDPMSFELSQNENVRVKEVNATKVLLCNEELEVPSVQVGEVFPAGALENTIYRPGRICTWHINSLPDVNNFEVDYGRLGPKDEITIFGAGIDAVTLRRDGRQTRRFNINEEGSLTISFKADNGPEVGQGFKISFKGPSGRNLPVLEIAIIAAVAVVILLGVVAAWRFVVMPARARRRRRQQSGQELSSFASQQHTAVVHGTNPALIATFEVFKYKANEEKSCASCAICQNEYKDGDKIMKLPCMHGFHDYCIVRWLQQSYLCPLCKGNVCPNDEHTRSGGYGSSFVSVNGSSVVVLTNADGTGLMAGWGRAAPVLTRTESATAPGANPVHEDTTDAITLPRRIRQSQQGHFATLSMLSDHPQNTTIMLVSGANHLRSQTSSNVSEPALAVRNDAVVHGEEDQEASGWAGMDSGNQLESEYYTVEGGNVV